MSKKSTDEEILGLVIKAQRQKMNKTQEVLGLDANLDRTYISMLERGEASPTIKTMQMISDALAIPLSELIKEYELFRKKGNK